jgi:hypothetical protein
MLAVAIGLMVAGLGGAPSQAAMVPAGVGALAEVANPVQATEVRWRGGRGGFRGGGWRGPRAFHRPVGFAPRHGYRRASWGPRPVYRRGYWGPRPAYSSVFWGFDAAPVYYVAHPGCLRRAKVWNGYRYVWRRVRVC